MEKVKLCRQLLIVSSGIETDEVLAEVIGYLEACRDRLIDVVEAGTQGLLGEDLFEYSLKVNDSVSKILEAERVKLGFKKIFFYDLKKMIFIIISRLESLLDLMMKATVRTMKRNKMIKIF